MIEETGVVKQVDKNHITIETQMKNACASCAQKSHCGTGVIARAVASRSHLVDVISERDLSDITPGQTIKIGIPEADLIRASALVYLLPLLALVSAALFGQLLLPMLGLNAEGWLILFTFIWVAIALRLIRFRTREQCSQRFQPQIISTQNNR